MTYTTGIILTSNKGTGDLGELIGDPAITTAILDRIIQRSEVIHLNGVSTGEVPFLEKKLFKNNEQKVFNFTSNGARLSNNYLIRDPFI